MRSCRPAGAQKYSATAATGTSARALGLALANRYSPPTSRASQALRVKLSTSATAITTPHANQIPDPGRRRPYSR